MSNRFRRVATIVSSSEFGVVSPCGMCCLCRMDGAEVFENQAGNSNRGCNEAQRVRCARTDAMFGQRARGF